MQILEELCGARLTEVSRSQASYVGVSSKDVTISIEGASLVFDLGTLVIENRFKVCGPLGAVADISSLIGCVVDWVEQSEYEINILLVGGAVVTISLRDEDWNSPEAVSYAPNSGQIIVIN